MAAEEGIANLARLAALASFIDKNPGVSIDEVSSHFGRTRKQVVKDVSDLFEAGFGDLLPDRMIDLDWESFESDGTLTFFDIKGLDVGAALGTAELALLLYGLHAIAPSLSERELSLVPGVVQKTAALAGIDDGSKLPFVATIAEVASSDKLPTLRQAIASGQLVSFDYVNSSGVLSRRLVQPLELSFVRDGWLLDAVDLSRGARRSFRLDRMGEIVLLDQWVPLSETLASQEDSREGAETVRLRLDPSAAWVALESTAKEIRQVGGGFDAIYNVWDRSWIRTEILLLAEHIRSVDPKNVRSEAASFASKALANWNEVLRSAEGCQSGASK